VAGWDNDTAFRPCRRPQDGSEVFAEVERAVDTGERRTRASIATKGGDCCVVEAWIGRRSALRGSGSGLARLAHSADMLWFSNL
jgi:hypothetical protein